MTESDWIPGFPGGTAVTRLNVYDWQSKDGFCGGAPHIHTVSTEAYVVISGTGEVQTLSADGFATHDLGPESLLWFSPGTIHRLVNSGNLELLVVMSNSGLPESGDAIFTFPAEILADPEHYADAARLPPPGEGQDVVAAAARKRRDLALEGYDQLRLRVSCEGPQALQEFHAAAARLVRAKAPLWRELWTASVLAETMNTDRLLTALENGRSEQLLDARVARAEPKGPDKLFGMCGRLQTWNTGQRANQTQATAAPSTP